MRVEPTKYGERVHYSASDVPGIVEEAREMFWEPFIGWRARLRCGTRPWDPYELDFRVHRRYVFRGADHDVERLLAAFQAFLDRYVDRVDSHCFPCHRHTPGDGM